MAEERLPLLRGRVGRSDTYEAIQRGGRRPKLPSVDPAEQRARVVAQIEALEQQILSRAPGARDPAATREVVSIRPVEGARLAETQLDDSSSDARLVGVNPLTNAVILDVTSLEYLKTKADAYVTLKLRTTKDGTQALVRPNETAIAPIGVIELAPLADISGPRLAGATLDRNRKYWFELGCRGGYRMAVRENEDTRLELRRQLARLGWINPVQEFLGPGLLYCFVQLTIGQVEALRAATDCILEVDLAPPPIRDAFLLDGASSADVRHFALSPPPVHAPSIVLLDSGISTGHPMLREAILSATTATPAIRSAEDTLGHGTNMAGIALYGDTVGRALEQGAATADHWIQGARLLEKEHRGTASAENSEHWPVLTRGAVMSAEQVEERRRNRAFVLAITRSMQDMPLVLGPTLWSQAVDQLCYDDGGGRLLAVSAGNARAEQLLALAQQYPQLQLSEKVNDPAQAANALTVGAFTGRVELPPVDHYREYQVVAKKPGGISPYTTCGVPGAGWPIKPDVVMEGGNLAVSPALTDEKVPWLSALTTSKNHVVGMPLSQINATSEAVARAGLLAARIWTAEPTLSPQSVRGLIVHAATWTPEMVRQFPDLGDRLLACGHGVPDENFAIGCTKDRATVVVEGAVPVSEIEWVPKKKVPKRPTTPREEPRPVRKMPLFRFPIPDLGVGADDPEVELRVTLSYFAEPSKYFGRVNHGMGLWWDMQGPQENETDFLARVNRLIRSQGLGDPRGSFDWVIGIQRRKRGTVQSDRCRGPMSKFAGHKLIAVIPKLGWWDSDEPARYGPLRFSLIATIIGANIYTAIRAKVEVPVDVEIEA